MRLVIELTENRELNIYTDADIQEVVIVDWNEVQDDADTMSRFEKRNPLEDARRELLHKTTGLKQVYP
jgi:hypothetical protein